MYVRIPTCVQAQKANIISDDGGQNLVKMMFVDGLKRHKVMKLKRNCKKLQV